MTVSSLEEICQDVNRVIEVDDVQELYGPVTRYYVDVLRKLGNDSLFNKEKLSNIPVKNGCFKLPERFLKPETVSIKGDCIDSSMYFVNGASVRFVKDYNGYVDVEAKSIFTNQDGSIVVFEIVASALIDYAIYKELLILSSKKNKQYKVNLLNHYDRSWRTAVDEARAVLNRFTPDDYKMLFRAVKVHW